MLVTAVVLVTFAFGLGQPALMAAVGGAVPADVRGVALGIATLVFLVGGGVGSAVVGGIGEVAGPGPQPAAARGAAARGLPRPGGHDPGGAGRLLTRAGPRAPGAPARLASPVMRPTDLELLRTPGVPTVSPDGRMAVVAVTRLDLDADEYRSQLWAVPTDGSAPARPITSGDRDTAPAFSPDGRWLAYLGAEPGGKPQVHLLPTAGGTARRLTDHRLGAGTPVWSPDSRRLAYTARVPEQGRYGTVEGVGPGAEPPRLITTLKYRLDDVGFLGRPPEPGVPARPARGLRGRHRAACRSRCRSRPATPTARTSTWSPDGGELAFVSARHERADRDLVRDVYVVRTDGSGLRRVTDSRGDCALPAYAPDGRTLLVTAVPDLGPDGLDFVARQAVPCRVDVAGGPLEPLLDPEQHHRGDETPATVVADGAVLVGVQRRGSVELLRVPLDGGEPEVLVDGPFTVRGVAAAGGVVVAVGRARPVRGGADRDHPGPPPAAHRLRPRRSARPAACTGCRSARRRRRTGTRCTAG